MKENILDDDLDKIKNTKLYKLSLKMFFSILFCFGLILFLVALPESDYFPSNEYGLIVSFLYIGMFLSNILSLIFITLSYLKKEDKSSNRNVLLILNVTIIILLSFAVYFTLNN